MAAQRIVRRRALQGDPQRLPQHLHPVLRRIYAARGITEGSELDYATAGLHAPDDLSGLAAAVEIVAAALTSGSRILVVGDFDADGATSCALVVRALRAFGVASVDYLIPNRFTDGYGLSPSVAGAAAEQAAHLLVTVDNGIASIEGVAAAKRCGMQVVITDHHLPGDELPAADAIVNPNRRSDGFPSKTLAGVGVAFYTMLAVRRHLRELGWFGGGGPPSQPALADLLDLVALGTVADLVPLDYNNRILVEQGLRRLRAGAGCPGIRALVSVAGREPARLVAADLGYAVAPRLNAAGRLKDMRLGVECLLSADAEHALRLAEDLDALNNERRRIERRMDAEAQDALNALAQRIDDKPMDAAICLYDPGWHQGVIGLLASRLRERFHRPVVAFAPDGPGSFKGSARSVPGVHIRDLLAAIATRHPGLLSNYGGHAMAAGLSLREADFHRFREALATEVTAVTGGAAAADVLETDGELQPGELSEPLAAALRNGGPWGQGFPEPQFDGRFRISHCRVVGQRHLKLALNPVGSAATRIDAIAFNGVERGWSDLGGTVRVVYRLEVNHYRGRDSAQLVVEHLEEVSR